MSGKRLSSVEKIYRNVKQFFTQVNRASFVGNGGGVVVPVSCSIMLYAAAVSLCP